MHPGYVPCPAQAPTATRSAGCPGIQVARTGLLTIEFERDQILRVSPDNQYEAWEIACLNDKAEWRLICPPDGDVALFCEPRMTPDRGDT
jgi:hypothetical protein